MWKYFKTAIEDILFLRIIFVLWAIPFMVLFVWACLEYSIFIETPLLAILPLGFMSLGSFLMYIGVFGSAEKVEKYSDYLNEGGELIGLIFVILVLILALPIWEVLRRNKNVVKKL